MPYTYLTPRDTRTVLQQHANQCANFGLILSRYVPREVINNETRPDNRHQRCRDGWLRNQCAMFSSNNGNNVLSQLRPIIRARLKRWLALTEGAQRFRMRLRSRMMVGLGGKGSLEVGLTLDHVTGLPIIPGSAIKGAVRSYALLMIAQEQGMQFDPGQPDIMNRELEKLEERIISGEDQSASAAHFRTAFGTQEAAGAFIFYDAVPTGSMEHGLFAADVMTPHFVRYYTNSGTSPPRDDDNPNPVSFITVDAGVEFAFALGARQSLQLTDRDMNWGLGVMLEALETLGIGAKTAAGYGTLVEATQSTT